MTKRRILKDLHIKEIKPIRKGKGTIFFVFVAGLLIVGVMNLANIYFEGQKIIQGASFEEFIELDALRESTVELKGDVFAEWREVLKAISHLQDIRQSIEDLEINELEDIASSIETHKDLIEKTADSLVAADEILKNVNESVFPEEIETKVHTVKAEFEKYSTFIGRAKEHIPAIENLLGLRYPHRYLILFQNNNEARPTGGFIGSIMVLDINDGELEKSQTHDVYDFDGQYHGYIEPPGEIAELTDQWRLRDSNYWPDFAVSGEKAAWFFQKEGGPSVDSVVAINQSILKKLLEITGPIKIPSLKSEITSENYDVILSYIIESKLTGETTPKEILKEFVPIVQEKALQKENFGEIVALLKEEISQKNLLAYSKNKKVQSYFDSIFASGRMIDPAKKTDYLNVVSTSISGNKSDKYIEQDLIHSSWISKDGEIQNQLKITKKHTFEESDLWGWRQVLEAQGFLEISETVKDILGRGTNKTVVRVYVPKDSELIETTTVADIEKMYDKRLDKEYFIFRMQVAPGEEKSATIDYKLPFKLPFAPLLSYKLNWQKQPGSQNINFTKKVSAEGLKNLSNYPTFIQTQDEVKYFGELLYDEYFASLWRK
jgi:hypothetical protein